MFVFLPLLYDPLTARWNGVDVLAEQYSSFSTYGYVGGNPISRVDLDGREYYYTTDGRFLAQYGDNDWVYIVPDHLNVLGNHGSYYANLQATGQLHYIGDYDDLIYTAATAYGESSHGFGVDNHDEVFGIANAIHNHKTQRLLNNDYQGSIQQAMVETPYAYAAQNAISTYVELRDANPEARNGTFMQTAIAAGINAMGLRMDLPGATDYAHGGDAWDGIDFEMAKYSQGFFFTLDGHKVLGLANNPVAGAPITKYFDDANGKATSRVRGTYSYKWNSTAMYGANRTRDNKYFFTIIMKVDENYNKAVGGRGY